jgi:hypothetical protein
LWGFERNAEILSFAQNDERGQGAKSKNNSESNGKGNNKVNNKGKGVLFAEHDALDVVSAAGGSVTEDEGGAHFGVSFCGFEFAGHAGEEAVEDEFGFDADDGVVWAGHADVGLVGGAVGKDALVGGGDVGMGSDDGGDASVEVPAEGYFFAGGFAVEVEEDDFGSGFALDLGEEFVGFAEGVVAGGHEDAALEVHDGVGLAGGEGSLVEAEAWSADGVVGGAEDAAAAGVRVGGDGHVFEDLFFVPDVVAGGDDVGAEIEELFGDGGGEAEASGSVFAVDDEEINVVGFKYVREMFADDVAAGGAKDVADEEDIH